MWMIDFLRILFSVGKSMFLCVPVFVLDGTLRTDLRILSDPYEKSWHSYYKKCHA